MDKKYKLFNNALAAKGQEWMKVHFLMVQRLGITEAITIRRLLQLQKFYADKNQLQGGWFFQTYEDICDWTGLTTKQVILAVQKLENTWVDLSGDEEDVKAEKDKKLHSRIKFLKDSSLSADQKKEKIIEAYEKAGYRRLLKTDISIIDKVKRKWYQVNKDVYDEFLKDGDGNICANIEDDKYWIIYNKNFAQQFGPIATIIFSDLYTTYLDALAEGTLINGKWIKRPMDKVAKKIDKTRVTVVNVYMPILKKAELIECETMGWDNTTHISINEDRLADVLDLRDLLDATKGETQVERITKQIIDKAKELSGQNWNTKVYEKADIIENRLNEGISEEDLLNVVDYAYHYYQRPNHIKDFKLFNFKYIYGKGRCKEQFISMMIGEDITKRLLFKIQEITNNKFNWDIDETKVNMIRKRINSGITEEQLIGFVKDRYTTISEDPNCKYTNFTFKDLFGDKAENQIKAYIHKIKEPKRGKKSKKDEPVDNVTCNSYTQEDINNFWAKAFQLEKEGKQGIF